MIANLFIIIQLRYSLKYNLKMLYLNETVTNIDRNTIFSDNSKQYKGHNGTA